jgi:hypothetical protein
MQEVTKFLKELDVEGSLSVEEGKRMGLGSRVVAIRGHSIHSPCLSEYMWIPW